MNQEDLAKVRRIFYTAVKLPDEERADFVRRSSADNQMVREELEKLLHSYDSNSFDERYFDRLSETDETTPKLKKGQYFSHYEIISPIGAGGMGEVFLARDVKLGRETALKILHSDLTEKSDRMRRFVQEAKAVSTLNHPNILTIYEIGEENGISYIATEFIKGETLGEKLKNASLSVEQILDVSVQIVSALSAAHKEGIIHRDIKPDNIMVRADGLVKVLDFGLVKLFEDESGEDRSEADTIINTNPGVVLGTISYMSPEQMRGEKADVRTDIWSFGVIFYEMLTGKRPFAGENVGDIIAETLKTDVSIPPETGLKNLADFEKIIHKSLAKNRAERYQNCEELSADLRQVKKRFEVETELERTGQLNFVSSAPKKANNAFRYAALLLVLPALVGAYFLWKYLVPPKNGFEKIEIKSLTTSGNIVESAISPDGKMIAYVKRGREGQNLLIRQKTIGTAEIKLTEPSSELIYNGITFTPDGGEIYFLQRPKNTSINRVFSVPMLGGQLPKSIIEDVDSPVQFSPDGTRFAFMRRNVQTGVTALMVADRNGSNPKILTERKSPLGFMLRPLDWSADGKKIICIANNISESATIAKRNVVWIDAETGEEQKMSEQVWREFESLAQTKTADGIIFTATEMQTPLQFQLWFLPFSGAAAQRLTNDVPFYNNVSVAKKSGEIIARQIQMETHVWVTDIKNSDAPRRVSPNNSDGGNGVAWSADGDLIYTSNLNGVNSLQKISLNGNGSVATLTTGDYALNQPCGTSDGKYFVYNSTLGNSMNLWRIDKDGGNLKQLIKDNGEFTDCAPDGKTVYFNAIRDGGFSSIWRISIDGGEPQRVTNRITLRPQISPDGKSIACYYRADAKAAWQIGILSVDDDRLVQVLDLPKTVILNTPFIWSKDGKNLIFVETRDGIANLWQYSLSGGQPVQITNFVEENLPMILNFKISPAGDKIAVVRGRRNADIVQIVESR